MKLRTAEIYFSEQDSCFSIPESISLFGFSISFYGVCLLLAALVGIICVKEVARRKKQDAEICLTLMTVVIVSALIGARLHYVLTDWQAFIKSPISLVQFRSGGLSYYGGLFGAWFGVKMFCRKTKTTFSEYADTLSMGAACAAPFIWTGCAFVREPLGRLYDGLFSVRIETEGVLREMHPVAIYGIVLSVVLFVLLCVCAVKGNANGSVFNAYLMMNAVLIAVLEAFRADSACVWGTEIPANYVISGVIVVTIWNGKLRQLIKKRREKRNVFITQ